MNKREAVIFDQMSRVDGSTFISIDTETTVDMLKNVPNTDIPNPQYGAVRKRQVGSSVMVFQNKRVNGYEAMVKRRLVAEGKDPQSFVLSNPRWGRRLENLPIVEHGGEYYLEVIFLHPGRVDYLYNGESISVDQLIGVKAYGKPEQGGLTNKVILRRFAFSSLVQMTINKRTIVF